MKAMIALMLTAVFTVAMLPAQAATVSANTGIITQTLSMGDGVDNRHCMLTKKQGKKLPGYCRP
ncbi:hypothetical protein [Oceanisphaera arctica]|uniref:Uncharacterized protein n=1 Tax=Oceanisphaera arctica TaxID=641510 RepID=A0A2P5TK85_9GAMM|nr:hypothetical protein [Oceanisphaera arctica]PPL15429.1 hypothetical protein UN63_12605 [Oceanisphaera arctica]GHA22457.1 hypothetical protein GCM10007082_23920 [Oceanisphaera arctica]